ncbi:MAG: Chaperone protein Skp [Gammaproteobacteria bacterium]|nr:Chaperone protein Skp [Gammaproteobacteria bacterium]
MKAKLIFSFMTLLAVMALPGTASAELKIGVVNAIKILEGAPQAEAARKQLEKEFASRDRDLVARQKTIKEMEDRLARDGATLSEADARKLERDIVSKRRDLKRDQDEFREDVNLRRNEEFGKIQKEIVQSIQDVAKSEGYDLVLGEGVIYASDKTDITNAVLERLRKGSSSP